MTMDTKLEEVPQTLETTADQTVTPEIETVSQENITVEEIKISGDALVAKIKALIHQGNIRRIIIKNEEGHTLIEIPMTVGVIGGVVSAAFFPVVAAIGVIGAMVAHLTLVIERPTSEDSPKGQDDH
jgi:uncharacterized membrane protein